MIITYRLLLGSSQKSKGERLIRVYCEALRISFSFVLQDSLATAFFVLVELTSVIRMY